jgi:hypothetical protein
MNFPAVAAGRAQQLVGQEVRPDAEGIDRQAADVSQSFGDDKPRPQARVMALHLPERVGVEGRDQAIGLEVLLAEGACHRSGQPPIRAEKLQLNVHLDPLLETLSNFGTRSVGLKPRS